MLHDFQQTRFPFTSPPPQSYVRLTIVPVSLHTAANTFVELMHQHNRPVQGAKFCIGVADEETGLLRGVVIVGRPIARMLQDGFTLEVTRCCTDGCPNACSMLYNAARRAAFAQGYRRLVTYTLQSSEAMSSLKAAGWELVAEVDPYRGKGWLSRPGRAVQEGSHLPKYRWETRAQSVRQRRIFPIRLPWKREPNGMPAPKTLVLPETLIFTGKSNQLDIATTVECTTRATTEEKGAFSTLDVAFSLEVELLKAQDCHLQVVNPPTTDQISRVLSQMAKRFPTRLIDYGYDWFAWRTGRNLL